MLITRVCRCCSEPLNALVHVCFMHDCWTLGLALYACFTYIPMVCFSLLEYNLDAFYCSLVSSGYCILAFCWLSAISGSIGCWELDWEVKLYLPLIILHHLVSRALGDQPHLGSLYQPSSKNQTSSSLFPLAFPIRANDHTQIVTEAAQKRPNNHPYRVLYPVGLPRLQAPLSPLSPLQNHASSNGREKSHHLPSIPLSLYAVELKSSASCTNRSY